MTPISPRIALASAVAVVLLLCSAPVVQTTITTSGPYPRLGWIRSNLPPHIQHQLNQLYEQPHIYAQIAHGGVRAYIQCVRYQLGCVPEMAHTAANPRLKGFYEAGIAMLTSYPLWAFEAMKWGIEIKELAAEEGAQPPTGHDLHSTQASHQPGEHPHPGRHRRETTPGTTAHPPSTDHPNHVTHPAAGSEHHSEHNATHSYPAEAQHWQTFLDFQEGFWGVVQHPGSVDPGRHRRESAPGTTAHPPSTDHPNHVTHPVAGSEHHSEHNATRSYPAEAQHWQIFFDFEENFLGVVQHPGSVVLSCYGTETDCFPDMGRIFPTEELKGEPGTVPHGPPAEPSGSEDHGETEYE